MSDRLNILVVYHLRDARPRVTLLDHLFSLRRYSPHRVFYLNVANGRTPGYLKSIEWDLVVFHYSFVSDRIVPDHFARLVDRVSFLRQSEATKVVIAQDEYIHGDLLCEFINSFGVTHVFSCAGPVDWPRIYRDVDMERVGFTTVLTGYLDHSTLERVDRIAASGVEKTLDIGYRSWYPWPSLGRHAQLKGLIGEVFAEKAPEYGLNVDISSKRGAGNSTKDTLNGDDWYRFLLKCKYAIGVEGGASVLDYDGSVGRCTAEYLLSHVDPSFEEVEASCFPGKDGSLEYLALSPRHLECCATKTCQVLVEGEYNGVLRPGEHYIELKRDLSNVDAALESIVRDDLREQIVERTYRDIVESGRWTYESFVQTILSESFAEGLPSPRDNRRRLPSFLVVARVKDDSMRAARRAKGWLREKAVAVVGEERVLSSMRLVKRLVGRA